MAALFRALKVAVFAAPGPLPAPPSILSGPEAFVPLRGSQREIQALRQFTQTDCGGSGPFSQTNCEP